jgi:hypothetical protein
MKPRKLTTALVLTLCASFVLTPVAQARSSVFNPDELEAAIINFYEIHAGTAPGSADLTDIDRQEMADALADMVAILKPTQFNDVVGHLAVDYRQNPEHREPIEQLSYRIYEKILPELEERREGHPVITVIDDVFLAFSLAYTFGFGKGLWRSRGSGLTGIARFKHVVKTISTNLPRGRRTSLALLGIGTTAGVIHAVYNHLETKKLDPKDLLSSTQDGVVTDLATKIAALRDELKAIKDADLEADPARYRTRLTEAEKTLMSSQKEMEHLYTAASQFRSRMQPIAEDLVSVRAQLSRLNAKLDLIELRRPPQAEHDPAAEHEGAHQPLP